MIIDEYLGLINNMAILGFAMIIVSFVQKGFFWKFFRVKTSFGKFTMIRLKEVNQWNYAIGQIIEGYLIFKTKDGVKRINITDKKFLYRSLGCTWLDLDNPTNALIEPSSNQATQTHDALKTDSLFKRCLYRPAEDDRTEKIKFLISIFTLVVGIAAAYMAFNAMRRADMAFMAAEAARVAAESIKSGFMVPIA